MRWHHILLEYDRSKTLANYGERLLTRLSQHDWEELHRSYPRSPRDATEFAQRVKSGAAPAWREWVLDRILFAAEEADPTKKKVFVPRILDWYIRGDLTYLEDLYKALEPLAIFVRFRNRFTGLDLKSISFRDFDIKMEDTTGELSQAEVSKAEENAWFESGQAKLYRNDKQVKIIVPLTKEAAQFFGRGTKWCTSAESERWNQWDLYSPHGPLYIILLRATGERWQIQFESAEFRDERDEVLTKRQVWDSPLRNWVDEQATKILPKKPALFNWISDPTEHDFETVARSAYGAAIIAKFPDVPDNIIRLALSVDTGVYAGQLFARLKHPTDDDADKLAVGHPSGIGDLPEQWRTKARRIAAFSRWGQSTWGGCPHDLTPEEIERVVEHTDAYTTVANMLTLQDLDSAAMIPALRKAFAKFPQLVMNFATKLPWKAIEPAFEGQQTYKAFQSLGASRDLIPELPTGTLVALNRFLKKPHENLAEFWRNAYARDIANELEKRHKRAA